MKKYALTCLPVICAAIAPLSADVARTNQQASKEMKYRSVNLNEITPPAPVLAKHSADPFLTAEYIFWRASQEGLEFGVNGITLDAAVLANSVAKRGHVATPKFGYDSGFKVGFGLKFRHDSWDLYANYTRLHTDADERHIKTKTNQALQSLWLVGENDTQDVLKADRAEASWKLDFNALDLELGRNYYISPRLTLRPHIGLKFGWVEQKLHTEYEDNVSFQGVNGPADEWTYKLKQEKFGVGIRAGLNTAWFMWNKWSVYGDFALAALYSDFDDHQHMEKQSPTFAGEKSHIMRFKSDFHTVTPVLELGLGLRFQTDFCNNNYEYMLQVGWEEQVWFNENQFSNLSGGRSGNLTLQGLTVKTGFAF